MRKKYNYNLYFLLSAIICLSLSVQIFAAIPSNAKKKSSKKTKSSIPTNCLTCLNNFSPETLTFTINAEKCPAILARCNKSTSTAKCEGIITDCFAANCTSEGSCSDEISNRSLAYGCLKAESAFLPYTCTSYISSFAKNKADEVQTVIDAKERAHQNALKQQEAKIAAEKAAAEKAAADAKVKAAQAEADAKARQAEIEAQNKLEQQKLQAQLEEQAKQAEIAREKQAKIDARNNKPNVKYNNILSSVKKDLSTAKTYTSKAYSLLGIEKINTSNKNNNSFFANNNNSPIVHVYAINGGTNAKAKSYINASKYKSEADYKCTKDTKESYIKNELLNALNVLQQSRNNLYDSISELEALNADDEVTGTISEDKINTLYEVQNKLTETINSIEVETNGLKTTCETRCAGVAAFTLTTSETKYDKDGLIITDDNSNSDYSCKEFESSSSNDLFSLLGGSSSMLGGGINQQITDLTQRVTKAVLTADRAIEEAEIAAATGNFSSTNVEYAVINSCIKYALDTDQYITCITNTLGEQLAILSKYPDNNTTRDTYYETVLSEFNNSVKVALELLTNQYPSAKCESDDARCCGTSDNIYTTSDARTCTTNLAIRLKKAKESDKKGQTGFTNGPISMYTNGIKGEGEIIYIQLNNSASTKDLASFVNEKCGYVTTIPTKCNCTKLSVTYSGTPWNMIPTETTTCESATCTTHNNTYIINSTTINTLCQDNKKK